MKSSRKIPMIGLTFFTIEVLSDSHKDKGGRYHYNCKCTLCGHLFSREGYRIRYSYRKCPSCGGGEDWKKKIKTPLKVGPISRRWWTARVIKSAKGQNNSKYKEYDIDIEYGAMLFEKQEGKCSLSGILLDFPETGEHGGTASLDRIDSSKGYLKENVQWVHKHINSMKLNYDQDYFIEMCKKVANKC